MEKVQSLADFLGSLNPPGLDPQPAPAVAESSRVVLEDITDAKVFAEAVLNSREFRLYVINSLVLGTLPSAIATRIMDYAWGKPPERVEVTGKDGQPIETVTEVRRIIIPAPQAPPSRRTH